MTPLAVNPSAATANEPTHACVRCGRPVPIDVALCEECNPLGLRQPAATQVHAIAAGGLLLAILILAVLARVSLSGVGPFQGAIGGLEAATTGFQVTLSVTNSGTKAGATTCRVWDASRPAGGASQVVQTPVVPAGETLTFSALLGEGFGRPSVTLAVDCASP